MEKKQLMGILNCTPDSFFDGGAYFDHKKALAHAKAMIEAGVDIIDIGGESTRPGSTQVTVEEELRRVLPLVEELSPQIPISIDTSKVEVAKKCVEKGATLLNDVTGFRDEKMCLLAAESNIKICVMHAQGTPENMQINPSYPDGITQEIIRFFNIQIQKLLDYGVDSKNIILDPGIGFGKTVDHNLEILRNIPHFKSLGFPLLLGASRKSFMSKIMKKPSTELLSTTLAVNTMSLLKGVDIVRVHDVREHRDMIDMLKRIISPCHS